MEKGSETYVTLPMIKMTSVFEKRNNILVVIEEIIKNTLCNDELVRSYPQNDYANGTI